MIEFFDLTEPFGVHKSKGRIPANIPHAINAWETCNTFRVMGESLRSSDQKETGNVLRRTHPLLIDRVLVNNTPRGGAGRSSCGAQVYLKSPRSARRVEAMRAATRMACFMLRASAWFLPAMSKAVP